MQTELGELRRNENALPQTEKQALGELAEARKRVETKLKAIERAAKGDIGPAETVESMARAAQLYKRLGLGIKKMHGKNELKFVLRLIDPAAPEREFSFAVSIDDDEKYHVRNVKPPVPGLDALVAQVNATNDFSAFVRGLRKKFVQLVQTQSSV